MSYSRDPLDTDFGPHDNEQCPGDGCQGCRGCTSTQYDTDTPETSDELDAEGRPKFPRAAALPAHPETLARAREAVNAARTLPRGLR